MLAAALLGGGLGAAATGGDEQPPTSDGGALAAYASSSSSGSSVSSTSSARPPAQSGLPVPVRRDAQPTALRSRITPTDVAIDSIGLRSTVRPVGVDRSGLMEIPQDVRVAGWYRHGSAPGEGGGATVLAAHVDSAAAGTGPWAKLADVPVGSEVRVSTAEGTVRYRISSVSQLRKKGLDTTALFSSSGPERLHLVTCGGRFDRATGHYDQNVVAIAVRVR